jgi:hypothetical protein
MATATKDKQAEKDAQAAKEQERAEQAKAREAEREAKRAEREAAKAKQAEERAAAKAAKEREKIEALAKENKIDLGSVTGTGEGDAVTLKDVREAVKAKKAEERANRPKKAPLTLSQRRAMLNLGDAGEEGVVPKTGFNALPLDYLVSVGLAETFDSTREITEKTTVDVEQEIPEAEREEGGPTTRTVKEKRDETKTVPATGYRLSETGQARVKEINPKWQTWKPDAAA